MKKVFEEVRKKLPGLGDGLRLSTGTVEFGSENMEKRICDLNCVNGSTIFVLFRQRGGSDPRVQMLQSCGNTNVAGVTTPSIIACPHFGALMQHTEACKHMNCPIHRNYLFHMLDNKDCRWIMATKN